MIYNLFGLQMLKERLCFDPEFWNFLTLRTYCLELISDNVMKAAVLNEMEEEEMQYSEELLTNCVNDTCTHYFSSCQCTEAAVVNQDPADKQTVNGNAGRHIASNALLKRRKWMRRLRRRKQSVSDEEADAGDDPEFTYNPKSTFTGHETMYSLRRNHPLVDNSASVKLPLNRKREYLARCVKSKILKRRGRKRRWLQDVSRPEQVQTVKVKGKKRGRKPLQKLELSYPENEIFFVEDKSGSDTKDQQQDMPHLENTLGQMNNLQKENGLEKRTDLICGSSFSEETQEDLKMELSSRLNQGPIIESQTALPAVKAVPECDGPTLELTECPIEFLHSYSLLSKKVDGEKQPPESSSHDEVNGDSEQEPEPTVEAELSKEEVSDLCLIGVQQFGCVCLKLLGSCISNQFVQWSLAIARFASRSLAVLHIYFSLERSSHDKGGTTVLCFFYLHVRYSS